MAVVRDLNDDEARLAVKVLQVAADTLAEHPERDPVLFLRCVADNFLLRYPGAFGPAA